ncbi:unnamed protein product [Brassica rapa]|uniref:Uncharacterized protein n=1 Tax=Brassica campestris TaxID=3711 RepID=A0A8D9D044_BRACM|nr:unnamed protein product [Brassica rapa]
MSKSLIMSSTHNIVFTIMSLQSQVSMMNNCFFCTSLCIRSLEDHLFTSKFINQNLLKLSGDCLFGASLSAIVVTFVTGSHDCSMRRRDRTEEPFFLEVALMQLKSLHFFIRPCLSHIHLLRS